LYELKEKTLFQT